MDQDINTQAPQPDTNLQFTGEPTPPPMAAAPTISPTTPPAKPKNSNKTIAIIAAFLAILVIGGVVALCLFQKPAEKDNKTADKPEETKPAVAKVEKYKFKERMTKDSYSLDDFDYFSLGKGEISFKTPGSFIVKDIAPYNIILGLKNDASKQITVEIGGAGTYRDLTDIRDRCTRKGDRTPDNIQAGKYTWCKIISELGENKYDYFEKQMTKTGEINDPNDGIIEYVYHMYFQLGNYYISFNHYTTSGDENTIVAMLNSIKDAFKLEDSVPYYSDLAVAILPTPANKEFASSNFYTVNLAAGYYIVNQTISETEGYKYHVYFKQLADDGFKVTQKDEEDNIELYTKDDEGYFRFNKDNLDFRVFKLDTSDKKSSAKSTRVLTIDGLKEALATLPDKE